MLLPVYTTTWEIHLTPCVYFRELFRFVGNKLVSKFLFLAQLVQTLSQGNVLFSVFWFSEFCFSSLISWFHNLEIFLPFLRKLCEEIIWWFWVTLVTVIFTCRYFKLGWNTSALSQSNCRNFPGTGSSIIIYVILFYFLNFYRLSVAVIYKGRIKLWITLIETDHLVDWSPEKNCCWQLTFQQPLRKLFEESRWLLYRLLKRQLPTTVVLRTPVNQMIIFNQGMLLLGSNHFLI